MKSVNSAFGSRGIGNYIHLDFQNYLDYGARRSPINLNRTKKKFDGENAVANFERINEELKTAIEQAMPKNANKKENATDILEDYLTGIYYPKTKLKTKEFNSMELQLATEVIFDGIDNVLNRLIHDYGNGKYENLRSVVQNGTVKNLMTGYLNQNEGFKRLKQLGAERSRIHKQTLEKIMGIIRNNLAHLKNKKNKTNDILQIITDLTQAQNELTKIIEEIESSIDNINITKKDFIRFKQTKEIKKKNIAGFRGEQLLNTLIYAVNLVDSIDQYNTESYGDIGEAGVASALSLIENGFKSIQIDFQKAASGIKGKNTQNFNPKNNQLIQISSFLKDEELIGKNKLSSANWVSTNSENGQVIIESRQKTQETIDFVGTITGNPFGLDEKMGVDTIAASIKNYYGINDINLLDEAPLLSVLSIGGIDISNHYLNFVAGVNKKDTGIINMNTFNNVLKILLAVRSLLGVKIDIHNAGNGQITLNEYLIVNSKQHAKFFVVDTKKFINDVYKDLQANKANYFITNSDNIDLSSANIRAGGDDSPPSATLAKQRIASILLEANAVKLKSSLNLTEYLKFD